MLLCSHQLRPLNSALLRRAAPLQRRVRGRQQRPAAAALVEFLNRRRLQLRAGPVLAEPGWCSDSHADPIPDHYAAACGNLYEPSAADLHPTVDGAANTAADQSAADAAAN